MMTDIPIIFSSPMILALLADRKTMTRRLLYSERHTKTGIIPASAMILEGHPLPRLDISRPSIGIYWTLSPWQRVKPGDRLWVRESVERDSYKNEDWLYSADETPVTLLAGDPRVVQMIAWTHHQERHKVTAIHMPRWASRLTLVVTATKIERLQDICDDDVRAEGLKMVNQGGIVYGVFGDRWTSPKNAFRLLWESLHGPGAWDANPELVALTFTVHKQNIDSLKDAA